MTARGQGAELIRGVSGREGRVLAARARAAGDSRQEHEVLARKGPLRQLEIRETPLMPYGQMAVMPNEVKGLAGTVGIAIAVFDADERLPLLQHRVCPPLATRHRLARQQARLRHRA